MGLPVSISHHLSTKVHTVWLRVNSWVGHFWCLNQSLISKSIPPYTYSVPSQKWVSFQEPIASSSIDVPGMIAITGKSELFIIMFGDHLLSFFCNEIEPLTDGLRTRSENDDFLDFLDFFALFVWGLYGGGLRSHSNPCISRPSV